MTRRPRRRPSWPVQFVLLCAALAVAGLVVTAAAHLIVGGPW